MRLWYLSHRRPARAQASLRIHADSPEPSLFAHMKCGSRRRVRPKIRHPAPLAWMAAHARLKDEFREDEKCHNLMSWLKFIIINFSIQELKLNTLLLEELQQLSGLLLLLACDLRKHNYKDYYQRDFPKLFSCMEEYSQLSEGKMGHVMRKPVFGISVQVRQTSLRSHRS